MNLAMAYFLSLEMYKDDVILAFVSVHALKLTAFLELTAAKDESIAITSEIGEFDSLWIKELFKCFVFWHKKRCESRLLKYSREERLLLTRAQDGLLF